MQCYEVGLDYFSLSLNDGCELFDMSWLCSIGSAAEMSPVDWLFGVSIYAHLAQIGYMKRVNDMKSNTMMCGIIFIDLLMCFVRKTFLDYVSFVENLMGRHCYLGNNC